ncbi:hypothetical protein F3J02_09655 [Acinetobacter sp. Tr-809]|uniref:PAAR domain-containing protein n=1 Tax=Acinetobacter TaxID=469 RepID=UPI00141F0A71|nr:PAAR domain-containing protein [Acinetobacter sp. Tr-809]NIE96739.1 hypothetical protein [Acinetobacter sp. Tr-809]
MMSPTFLHELAIEQLQHMSQEDIEQTLKAEQLYWENKPQTLYYLAVNGAKTKNGGLVRASYHYYKIAGMSIARVGDDVIYIDGTTSKIIAGAGQACVLDGVPVALVGSHLENGDEIIDSPNTSVAIRIFKDQPKIDNFLSSDTSLKD